MSRRHATTLQSQGGVSQPSTHSYRDAAVILLQFVSKEKHVPDRDAQLADIDAAHLERFLMHTKTESSSV